MAEKTLSPRQKMIGMMYLVLTAMLALNVQREILDAFVVIDEGLLESASLAESRNDALWSSFNFSLKMDEEKVKPYHQSAQEIHAEVASIITLIDSLNREMISKTEGLTLDEADTIQLAFVDKKDLYDVSTNLMVGPNEDISKGQAKVLKERIQALELKISQSMAKFQLPNHQNAFAFNDKQVEGQLREWEKHSYYDVPLAAVIALHDKMKNDLLNLEYNAVGQLLSQVAQDDIPVDTVVARVIPKSSYLVRGQDYEASVFLGAFSSTSSPKMYVLDSDGSKQYIEVEAGSGKYVLPNVGVGQQHYSGAIEVVNNQGQVKSFPFESEFNVVAPSASIAATAMNVVYKGVDNPFSVSVPGFGDDEVRMMVDGNHQLNKTAPGKYNLVVNKSSSGNMNITVQAKMDGNWTTMNQEAFRIKSLPDPNARINTITGSGKMKVNDLAAQSLIVEYDKDFIFNLSRPKLISFEVVISDGANTRSKTGRSMRLSEEIKTFVKSARPGNTVYFEDIMVEGNDGRTIKLPPLVIKIIR
jgi:gliding motility-associated protein GldM